MIFKLNFIISEVLNKILQKQVNLNHTSIYDDTINGYA